MVIFHATGFVFDTNVVVSSCDLRSAFCKIRGFVIIVMHVLLLLTAKEVRYDTISWVYRCYSQSAGVLIVVGFCEVHKFIVNVFGCGEFVLLHLNTSSDGPRAPRP